jgi:hypothetical protein
MAWKVFFVASCRYDWPCLNNCFENFFLFGKFVIYTPQMTIAAHQQLLSTPQPNTGRDSIALKGRIGMQPQGSNQPGNVSSGQQGLQQLQAATPSVCCISHLTNRFALGIAETNLLWASHKQKCLWIHHKAIGLKYLSNILGLWHLTNRLAFWSYTSKFAFGLSQT